MPIKTFRGMIADGSSDIINLHTNTGATGYRIRKFQVIPAAPGSATDVEAVMKIYKVPQTAVTATVDFSDPTLLGCAYFQDEATQHNPTSMDVIFDTEIFNQDIYLTYESISGGQSMNYYIELEQIKLDMNENTVATLKDIRNIATQG